MTTVGPLVGGVNPLGWVDLRVNLNHCVRHCIGLPSEAELFPAGSSACQNLPLGVFLVSLVELSSGVV